MIRQLIEKNRTYRRFDQSVSISREQIENWIDLARLSSSGANLQSLKYYISTEESSNEKIFETLKWAGYLENWVGPAEGEKPTAYVIVFRDDAIATKCFWDHGIAAQSILLGATEEDFGGCMFASMNKEQLMKQFSFSHNLEILMVIALGKPVEKVVLEEIENENIRYYRDKEGVHHVPKRRLQDILVE